MSLTKLHEYFPMIRTREQILHEIESDASLNRKYESFTDEEKEEFINICTGEKGVKILYDSFFNSVMNPDLYPERLKDLIECILGKSISTYRVLSRGSFALGDEKSLVILDIVVELAGGSIINLEVQKIGYAFPGERAACYSSDLTLRQYARARRDASEKAKTNSSYKFSYRSIHPVYTIVLIEKSGKPFSDFPETYIHRFSQKSDTGLPMELIQNYIFIPLDIFHRNHQNGVVSTKLDAWLMFLSSDEPDKIMCLCDTYPEFKPLYNHVYEICLNTEDVMGFFSEELAIMDRNTVDYMIEEAKADLERAKAERDQVLAERDQVLAERDQVLAERDQAKSELAQAQADNEQLQQQVQRQEIQFRNDLDAMRRELQRLKRELIETRARL